MNSQNLLPHHLHLHFHFPKLPIVDVFLYVTPNRTNCICASMLIIFHTKISCRLL